jgi:uncharacterized protein
MKRTLLSFLLALFLSSVVFAGVVNFVFPKPQGYVSDYADLLDSQTRLRIEQLARTLDLQTGAELAVVIVKSTLPYDYLEYANRLFANWHIGKAGKDNGVLLLLALNERKIKIETGYGIEDIITDGRAGELLDTYVVPKLRENNYSEAMYNGSLAIAKTIADHYKGSIEGDYYPVERTDDSSASVFQILFFLIVLSFVLNSRYGWLPFIWGSGSLSGPGYSSFGSFGGGFGSFGGGMSGGGGASRSF